MANPKIIFTFVLAFSCCLVTFQAIADVRNEANTHRNVAAADENARVGVLNRIDLDNGLLVIDDLTFGFSPRQLTVYRGGHVSSMRSLHPNQQIRYSGPSNLRYSADSNVSANRMISKIWIEKK